MQTGPTKRFDRTGPTASKVYCPICLTSGYGPTHPTTQTAAPWQRNCLKGHQFVCCCGRAWPSKQARATHITAMNQHHPREHHCSNP